MLTRLLDLIWAYPAILLGVAIGTSLALGGITLGPLTIKGDSLFIPALIIGFVNIPYVAKPIRGQVIALRENEFVDAARILNVGGRRIMLSEILPNLSSTIVVFVPLMIANSILLEAALSFLGAGVQPPNASWGTMISDGVQLITTSPYLVLVPGCARLDRPRINIFGEGVRDALDPAASKDAQMSPLRCPPAAADRSRPRPRLDLHLPDLSGDPERQPGSRLAGRTATPTIAAIAS